MAKIKVTSKCELYDGMSITFRAPCSGSAVDGLNVYYNNMSQSFSFRDANGNDLAGMDNLFSKNAYIKAVLDTGNGYAYLQNADTNSYVDKTFNDLSPLSRFQRGLGNEYVWKRAEPFTGDLTKELTDVTIFSGYTEYATTDIYAAPSYSIIGDSYMLSRSTPITTGVVSSILQNVANYNYLQGNYVVANGDCRSFTSNNATGLYFIPPDAKVTVVDRVILVASKAIHIWGYGDHERIDYVNSPDPNAYPINDGYTYTPLGQLGNKMQVATGTYTGTGKYGSSNKNRLTFEFTPKMWGVYSTATHEPGGSTWYRGPGGCFSPWGTNGLSPVDILYENFYDSQCVTTYSGNTVSWYNTTNASYQLNQTGDIYYYFAIG